MTWRLFGVRVCGLFGAEPSSEPIMTYRRLEPWENLYHETTIFINKNGFVNFFLKISAPLHSALVCQWLYKAL